MAVEERLWRAGLRRGERQCCGRHNSPLGSEPIAAAGIDEGNSADEGRNQRQFIHKAPPYRRPQPAGPGPPLGVVECDLTVHDVEKVDLIRTVFGQH